MQAWAQGSALHVDSGPHTPEQMLGHPLGNTVRRTGWWRRPWLEQVRGTGRDRIPPGTTRLISRGAAAKPTERGSTFGGIA